MRTIGDKILILNKIKSHYNFKSDAEFARFLDIKPNSLANWYARNTLDYEKIFTKCDGLNANWLMSGEGDMFNNSGKSTRNEIVDNEVTSNNDNTEISSNDYWRGRYDQLKEDHDRLLEELRHIKSASAS